MQPKKSKTRKKKVTFVNKNQFIKSILQQWKKQTDGGNWYRDKKANYKDDYYLCLKLKDDYNHIHLILNQFKTNHNLQKHVEFVMKKYNDQLGKPEHSNTIKSSIFSDPEIVVHNIIRRFNEFNELN